MGVISQSQRPKSLVQSQNFGTVPEAQDSPGMLGLSQRPRVPTPWCYFSMTVLGRLDCPKDPESQHHGGYFAISETQNHGSVLGLWDCPRSPGQSWDVGTVPEARDSPRKCSNFMVFDTCCWPLWNCMLPFFAAFSSSNPSRSEKANLFQPFIWRRKIVSTKKV